VNWTLTIYSNPSCRYCHRLMKQLDSENVEYTSVDIKRDSAAAEHVIQVNGENQTVVFPDGSGTTGWIDRRGTPWPPAHPADVDRPDPWPGRARSGRPMRVHTWSGTVRRDDGGPHGVAMLPGVDAQTRARLDARLVGTSSCAR